MNELQELAENINVMKAQMKVLRQEMKAKKDCAKKNDKYNNDEVFRETRKTKSREYYYKVIKPRNDMAKAVKEN